MRGKTSSFWSSKSVSSSENSEVLAEKTAEERERGAGGERKRERRGGEREE